MMPEPAVGDMVEFQVRGDAGRRLRRGRMLIRKASGKFLVIEAIDSAYPNRCHSIRADAVFSVNGVPR